MTLTRRLCSVGADGKIAVCLFDGEKVRVEKERHKERERVFIQLEKAYSFSTLVSSPRTICFGAGKTAIVCGSGGVEVNYGNSALMNIVSAGAFTVSPRDH